MVRSADEPIRQLPSSRTNADVAEGRRDRGGPLHQRAGRLRGGAPPQPPQIDTEAKAKIVENERWKYLATFVNTVAAASIAIGILTPTAGYLSKIATEAPPVDVFTAGGALLVWFGVAAALHSFASFVLGNLRP
ncbi:hypothetical protein [Methylobacterium sp. E-045]|uniref:hypothetical protein n=1 Tax=Methylobacterium sp. E-045 TaxID=2836575 RepID=UPI001FBB6642|nr:hypothetical protein [Methylobacterium sp. E-045]MCJ2127344.1 hypothetical protein [Methylobacterium sp. E-045]